MSRHRPAATGWPLFLARKRQETGDSIQGWFEKHYTGLQLSKRSRASYDALEKGRRDPKPHEVEYLTRIYGGGPTDADRAPSLTALSPVDLADALARLTVELEAMRQERAEWTRGWMAIFRAFAAGQVPVELLDALAPPLPADVPR